MEAICFEALKVLRKKMLIEGLWVDGEMKIECRFPKATTARLYRSVLKPLDVGWGDEFISWYTEMIKCRRAKFYGFEFIENKDMCFTGYHFYRSGIGSENGEGLIYHAMAACSAKSVVEDAFADILGLAEIGLLTPEYAAAVLP